MAEPQFHQFFGSSSVDSATWDPETGEVSVTFHNGGSYTYGDMDAQEWARFKAAPSVGKFVHQALRGREV